MSRMLAEAREGPETVARQLADSGPVRDLAARLRATRPIFAMTIARGSSDHAANFARYLFETGPGLVTASGAPSVVTLYGRRLHTENAFTLAISQSGQSPDIIAMAEAARARGGLTAAMVNVKDSPLAAVCAHRLPLAAGPEVSVAASKSVIATMSMTAQLLAHWCDDAQLHAALGDLPARLEMALSCDWSPALAMFGNAAGTLVLARGRTYPAAQEAALKFKEVCALHAEPFSAAEVQHGPMSLITGHFPLLALATADETLAGLSDTLGRLRGKGARIAVACPRGQEKTLAAANADILLPLPAPLHPVLDPILALQAFYLFVAALAEERGYDPDTPRHLRKVTLTR